LADDSITDLCLIYIKSDLVYAKNFFRFPENKIKVVGNPDISRFGLKEDDIQSFNYKKTTEANNVMYVDTSLVIRGAIFTNFKEYIDHIVSLRNHLAKNGKHLIVKLHPNFDTTDIPELLEKAKIDICSHELYVDRLKSCSFAITEASTAGLIPAYMGMPIFLAQFGPLKNHMMGSIFTTYPRAIPLFDISILNKFFENNLLWNKIYESNVDFWINENLGPRPIEKMAERVVNEFFNLIDQKKKIIIN